MTEPGEITEMIDGRPTGTVQEWSAQKQKENVKKILASVAVWGPNLSDEDFAVSTIANWSSVRKLGEPIFDQPADDVFNAIRTQARAWIKEDDHAYLPLLCYAHSTAKTKCKLVEAHGLAYLTMPIEKTKETQVAFTRVIPLPFHDKATLDALRNSLASMTDEAFAGAFKKNGESVQTLRAFILTLKPICGNSGESVDEGDSDTSDEADGAEEGAQERTFTLDGYNFVRRLGAAMLIHMLSVKERLRTVAKRGPLDMVNAALGHQKKSNQWAAYWYLLGTYEDEE